MPLKTHMDEQPELNLTPMIDIVFLLIIFFMVSTKVSEMERKIALDVPRISNTEALSPAPRKRVVNILRDGRILLDQEEVTVEELVRRLQLQRQNGAVEEMGNWLMAPLLKRCVLYLIQFRSMVELRLVKAREIKLQCFI